MKHVRTVCFLVVVLFLCACPALGVVEFKDGGTHDIDYAVPDVVRVDYGAPLMYTTVNLLDGGSISYPYGLQGHEHSQINISGGSIGTDLYAYGSSQISISGGLIGTDLYAYGSSQISICGGSIGTGLYYLGNGRVNISGGSIGALESSYSSQVDISGGSIGSLLSHSSSQVNISGGSINGDIYSESTSRVDISGGSIEGRLVLRQIGTIEIYGSDFAVDGQPVGFGELTSINGGNYLNEPCRHLSGTLLSGELIDNDFYIGSNARIVLSPVPEPATIVLLGLGGLLLRKRRKA